MDNILQSKPKVSEASRLLKQLKASDKKLQETMQINEILKSNVARASKALIEEKTLKTLENIDIEEINKSKLGIRVASLRKAGFNNFLDIYKSSPQDLYRFKGIGEDTAYKLKGLVYDSAMEIRNNTSPTFSIDYRTREADEVVRNLYIYISTQPLFAECLDIYKDYHYDFESKMEEAAPTKNPIVWLFSSRENNENAVRSYLELKAIQEAGFTENINRITLAINQFSKTDLKTAWADFEINSANYFAVLEKLQGVEIKDNSKNYLSDELVYEIDKMQLDLTGLKCTLRSYQNFAVKYILHQENVLVGDEMGLGKTIQAIASMVVLRNQGFTHFVVVCPASVLINWCREREKHSDLKAVKIHGEYRDIFFDNWKKYGGVAVTTYETLSKIAFETFENIAMLTVDEAHYVKNPEAIRSKELMEVRAKAKRVMFMTGTALENRVDEMCYLISCLDPKLALEVEGMQHLSSAPIFREKVAPVYLRRTREDVLQELPDLIEKSEWSEMTEEERQEYYQSTMSRNFMSMRQVSWRVQDIKNSSKANRLLEICKMAKEEGRKVIVFSFFLNTIERVRQLLGDNYYGPIDGSVPPDKRQEIIDEFTKAEQGSVLLAQIQAGGTGVNIQTASVVVICEPQLKPSTENQAISRTYRMGQVRNVKVFKLLCEESIDERIMDILENKETIFDNFADISSVGQKSVEITEKMAKSIVESEVARLQQKEDTNK